MTTTPLNQDQVNAALRSWEMRIEARPTSEEYAVFAPLRDEWERLNGIPEAQRTPWQVEAHAELFDRLITDYWSPWYAWSKLNISDKVFKRGISAPLESVQELVTLVVPLPSKPSPAC